MPDPVFATSTHVAVFEEQRALSSPEYNDEPEEEKSKIVQWSQPKKSAEYKRSFAAREVPTIDFHQH